MNRLKLAAQLKQVEKELTFDSPTFHEELEPVDYSLFGPLHYEQNYAYPLVVWLHEKGETHRQLHQVMPKLSMRNYVAIAPESMSQPDAWSQNHESISSAEKAVSDSIRVASDRYNIATGRIFIAGSGAGGTMAFRLALSHPDWFAGVLSFGGAIPENLTPLADFKRCRNLPLFVSHGRESTNYDIEKLCSQLRLLYSSGFDVTARQYPDGDELQAQVLNDMNVWMMEIVTGQPSSPPQSQQTHTIVYGKVSNN